MAGESASLKCPLKQISLFSFFCARLVWCHTIFLKNIEFFVYGTIATVGDLMEAGLPA